MPTRYIQKNGVGINSGDVLPSSVAAINVNASGELEINPGALSGVASVKQVVPPQIVVSVDLDANSVDKTVFIANAAYQIAAIRLVESTTASGATIDVKKCTTTTAPASGTAVCTQLVLDTTANTVQSATLVATTATLQLAAGNRLAIDMTGTLTGLVAHMDIYLKRI